jgi:hypothetical protein
MALELMGRTLAGMEGRHRRASGVKEGNVCIGCKAICKVNRAPYRLRQSSILSSTVACVQCVR